MELKIIHFYPDLMSLYGSYANVSVLRRYLEALGCAVTVQAVVPGEGADITGRRLSLHGGRHGAGPAVCGGGLRPVRRGGEGRSRRTAPPCCSPGRPWSSWAPPSPTKDGETYPGIGLASFTTVQGKRRIVGDVYGVTALFPEAVVGFMNKCGQIRGVEAPLLTGLSLGFGNEAEKGPEGFHWKNVFASELTGPVLVKNPRLLEAVADAICTRRGISLPEERPSFPYAEAGYAITAEQLKLRAEARQ